MHFSALAAGMVAVAAVSALPQKISPHNQEAPPLDLDIFHSTKKFVVPLTLPEAKAKFGDDIAAAQAFGSFEAEASDSINPAASGSVNAKASGSKNALAKAEKVQTLSTLNAVNASLPTNGSVSTSASATCSKPRNRPEWESVSNEDRQAYIDAVKCLMKKPASGKYKGATTRYEDLVSLHQAMTPNIHGNDIFLIWHRYYLWTFEDMLRTECGYTKDLPWFDETKFAGNFTASSIFSPKWYGSVDVHGECVTDGQFNSTSLTLHIGAGTTDQAHCISRAYDAEVTSECSQEYVDYCNKQTDYHSMADCSEGGPHAQGHNGIGGVMSDVYASPSDPVFWLHHSFVDRMFQNWQVQDAVRVASTAINGYDSNYNALTMNTKVDMSGLRPTVSIKDVFDTQSTLLCYKYSY